MLCPLCPRGRAWSPYRLRQCRPWAGAAPPSPCGATYRVRQLGWRGGFSTGLASLHCLAAARPSWLPAASGAAGHGLTTLCGRSAWCTVCVPSCAAGGRRCTKRGRRSQTPPPAAPSPRWHRGCWKLPAGRRCLLGLLGRPASHPWVAQCCWVVVPRCRWQRHRRRQRAACCGAAWARQRWLSQLSSPSDPVPASRPPD